MISRILHSWLARFINFVLNDHSCKILHFMNDNSNTDHSEVYFRYSGAFINKEENIDKGR